MDDNVSKWSQTGLLEGNEGYDAVVLADLLEECKDYLLSKKEEEPVNKIQCIANCIFPVIVRIFNERNIRTMDMDYLYEKIWETFQTSRGTEEEEIIFARFVEDYEVQY